MTTDKLVDLHVHSTFSDGTKTPEELVAYALEKGLTAFALTDHDTIDGVARAQKAAEGTSLCVIPGIEFSTTYLGSDVHIVGIDLDLSHPLLLSHLESFRRSRDERNEKMVELMAKDGIDISVEKIRERYHTYVLTRAHISRYLYDTGYTSSIQEAFQLYIGENKPYYVERKKITPHEVVRLIDQIGGIPILAHPMLITQPEENLRQLIKELLTEGLIGIEAIYSTYSDEQERFVRSLADEYQLTISGGSDYHGDNKPGLDLATGYHDSLRIGEEVLKNLRIARRSKNVR